MGVVEFLQLVKNASAAAGRAAASHAAEHCIMRLHTQFCGLNSKQGETL